MNGVRLSKQLKAHYDDYYDGPSPWREIGAADKARNVAALCCDVRHASVLEVGCGEGALLARLSASGFAARLSGVDISASGIAVTRERAIPGLIEAAVYDGLELPYPDGHVDLVVLSHVLEHCEHPRQLLYEAARVGRHVFVEVPLEDNWRLPAHFVPDPVGHINFYRPKTLRQLVESCGLRVARERITNPSLAAYRHRLGRRGALSSSLKELALRIVPALATRLLTYHGALLCSAPPVPR